MPDRQAGSADPSGPQAAVGAGPVFFGGDFVLEGVLEWPETGAVRGGVVVAHPHPLHGGTMAQPVVYRCAQAAREAGFATLRFNFRGVGRSTGAYSGRDEYRDVEAAAAYLRNQLSLQAGEASGGATPLALVGYSFGSVMVAVSAMTVMPDALVLIGFTVESELFPRASLERLRSYPNPVLAVSGESDDLTPPDAARRALETLGLDYRMVLVAGTGHFFEGRQREVGSMVASFLADSFPATSRRP